MSRNNRCVSLVHHHLEPGGVTQVVELSAKALAAHLPGLEEIRLVSGRSGGAEALLKRLEPDCAGAGVSVTLKIIEEIDYLPADIEPSDDTKELADSIRRKLLSVCSGSVWMVHNYQLGKNPLFTRALLNIAQDHPEERLCFYIHDFPECSRYENLSFSRQFIPNSPYPVAPNVRYVVINSRDLRYLTEAGIPDSCVFLVNNPVPDEKLPEDDREKRRARFERELFEEHRGYVTGAPLFLYPVRTIRRKNVLEMGLISAAAGEPINLLVTLPGVSHTEKEYSDKVENAFAEGLIPGIWGIGIKLQQADIPFPDLVSVADVICSSSVQEGFGYLFINSKLWGMPILARYLEVLDGIKSVFDDHPACFYRSVFVPLASGEIRSLKEAYAEKARSVESLTGEEIVNSILRQFEDITVNGACDFSYFPVERQLEVLKKIKTDTAFRNDLIGLNGDIFEALDRFSSGLNAPDVNTEPDSRPFSFERYAGSVAKVIESFGSESKSAHAAVLEEKPDVQENLIRKFASIEYLRLLYDN